MAFVTVDISAADLFEILERLIWSDPSVRRSSAPLGRVTKTRSIDLFYDVSLVTPRIAGEASRSHYRPMCLRLPSLFLAILALIVLAGGGWRSSARCGLRFRAIDTSLDGATYGPRADETERLKKISDQLRKALSKGGRFEVVDIAPVKLLRMRPTFRRAEDATQRLPTKAGADLSITGTVQKVSNLILNMNIYIRDAASKKLIASRSADFRSNTDDSSVAHPRLYRPKRYLLTPNFGTN